MNVENPGTRPEGMASLERKTERVWGRDRSSLLAQREEIKKLRRKKVSSWG